VTVTIHFAMEHMKETAHPEAVWKRLAPYWEGASDRSGTAVQSNTLFHMAPFTWQIFCVKSRVYSKTKALGPIVQIAWKSGAAT
jgi:hypothetical protein